MQGLADGYFILPYTIADYLGRRPPGQGTTNHPAFAEARAEVLARTARLLAIRGTKTVDEFHRELGTLMWDRCGMSRSEAGLTSALERLPSLREEFWRDAHVVGGHEEFNQALERAGRVADLLELAELICQDALERRESCGGHFRVECQTPDGEARRDDAAHCVVSAWEFTGVGKPPALHKEPLAFDHVQLTQRSYK